MTAIAERHDVQRGDDATARDEQESTGFGGWSDWAEWVQPEERSLAAVSASALEDRIERLYAHDRERICPAATRVIALIDLSGGRDEALVRERRVLIMRRLREHFPFVEAIAAVTPTRYAVLARRHSGLAGTLSTLEHRLRAETNDLGSVAAVWCEPLPEDPGDIRAMMRGLRIVPRITEQDDRAALAGASSVEILAGADVDTEREADSVELSVARWAARSLITALVCAILVSGLGVGAITASVHPWTGNEVASTDATTTTAATGLSSVDASRGVMSVLAPGAPDLLDQARGWLRDARAQGLVGEDVAHEPAPPTPSVPDPADLPQPVTPPIESPAVPKEPEEPGVPLPDPEPVDPEPLPIPQTGPSSEPLLPELPLVDGVVSDVTDTLLG